MLALGLLGLFLLRELNSINMINIVIKVGRFLLKLTLSFLDFLLRLFDGSEDSLDDESSSASLLLLSDSESEVSAAFPRFDFFFLDLGKKIECFD